ncbi:MAG TPA: hypothetical protein VFH03_19650, partial [Actinoplanes sp.]|nr:hypothetical protein [Actinoplanes sp.]
MPSAEQRRPPADTHPADEIIRQARRAAGRLQYAAESADRRRSDRGRSHTRVASARRATGAAVEYVPRSARTGRRSEPARPAARTVARRHAADRRGKHAMPAAQDPLGITVTPIRLGAVRDWALDTGDGPPATGSHRAPGTLPIESWLLIGKSRQQALLAGLVAAGLALVMLPTAVQRANDVNQVNAAGKTVTTAPTPAAPAERDQRRDDGDDRDKPVRRARPAAPEASRSAPPARPAP